MADSDKTVGTVDDDHAWEKQYAPKIGRGRVILTLAVYGIFLLGLAAIATQRWFFGALQ